MTVNGRPTSGPASSRRRPATWSRPSTARGMTMRPSETPDPVVVPTTGVTGAASAPAAAVESDNGGWFDTGGAPVARFDVAVIGAGPAGLAASVAAVEGDARVVLIDASPRIGGQYWRHRAARRRCAPPCVAGVRAPARRRRDGDRCGHARPSRRACRSGTSGMRPDGFVVHALRRRTRAGGAGPHASSCATGAYDRQLPFPGWTLPGVYTAGATQALLKGHGVVVGRRIVVAGTGPFLLPVATGLAEAGATVVGVFEAGRPTAFAAPPADGPAERVEAARGRRLPAGPAGTRRPVPDPLDGHRGARRRSGHRRPRGAAGARLADRPGVGAGARVRRRGGGLRVHAPAGARAPARLRTRARRRTAASLPPSTTTRRAASPACSSRARRPASAGRTWRRRRARSRGSRPPRSGLGRPMDRGSRPDAPAGDGAAAGRSPGRCRRRSRSPPAGSDG